VITKHDSLNRQSVLFNFSKDQIGRDEVLTEGWRLVSPNFPDNVVKASVVQQKLRQYLLQDFHPIAKIGKVG